MTQREARARLKDLIAKWADDFKTTSEKSRTEFMKYHSGMIPAHGCFYGNEARAEFERRCWEYQAQAEKILQEQLQQLRDKMVDPPSEEAINTIKLLSLRTDLTHKEVELLLDKYGDNDQAYRAIASVAAEKGVMGYASPLDEKIKDMEALISVVNRTLTATSAEGGHAGEGFIAMLNMQIDSTLSDVA